MLFKQKMKAFTLESIILSLFLENGNQFKNEQKKHFLFMSAQRLNVYGADKRKTKMFSNRGKYKKKFYKNSFLLMFFFLRRKSKFKFKFKKRKLDNFVCNFICVLCKR